MGLPVNNTVVEEPCLEGYEKLNGKCMAINSKLNDKKFESSLPSKNVAVPELTTLKNVVVLDDQPVTVLTTLKSLVVPELTTLKSAIVPDENPVTVLTTLKNVVVPDDKPISGLSTTENPVTQSILVTELNTIQKLGACSEGMEHGEHGICRPIKVPVTTEINIQSTTDLNDNLSGPIDLTACPKGMKHDEQGDCQEIDRSNIKKPIIDPKILLKPDGSCPDNYQMIDKRCLYMGVKKNSTVYSNELTSDKFSNRLQAKSGNGETEKIELIPVLADNTCPPGTESWENGLCRKSVRPLISKRPCPDNYELTNGKCIHKISKVPKRIESTTILSKINSLESTTLIEEPIRKVEHSKGLTPLKSTTEPIIDLQSETTSVSS